MTSTNEQLSNTIEAQLASKKLAKRDLAQELGMTREHLGRKLSNKYSWSLPELDTVSRFLGYKSAFDLVDLSKTLIEAEHRLSATAEEQLLDSQRASTVEKAA